MSNHKGSYLLNKLLKKSIEIDLFKKLEKEDTRAVIKKVLAIGINYDCNPGEMLEDVAEDFEICYCCLEFDKPLLEGICQKCGAWD